MLAFYHCISNTRPCVGPAWLRLGCNLPVMPHQRSYEQATNALNSAEMQLEAIFYRPFIYDGSVGTWRVY
jgi:hypothetical protein